MIDSNVTLFQWPFRRLRHDEPGALAEKLQAQGITQAWAGSFEGLLHRDVAAVNVRLAEVCRLFPMFVPFGAVNPALPDWEEDLRRCAEEHRMPGLRLFPNYHGYALIDAPARRLLEMAAERRLLVQIPLVMEDERTQHPLLRVPPVEVAGLPPLLREIKGLRVELLNAFRSMRVEEAKRLAAAGDVYFEIAMLEGVGGIRNLLQQVAVERVLFGTHAPLFYTDSAVLKLTESALSEEERGGDCGRECAEDFRVMSFLLRKRVLAMMLAGCGLFMMACAVLVWDGFQDEEVRVDVALVPGNTVRLDGTPSARLAARLDRTLEIYRAGLAPLIFVSGGVGKEGWDEAEVMRGYLVNRGVPAEAVTVDSGGVRTLESAVNLRRFMQRRGLTRAMVVTQYFHVPRTKLALQKAGVAEVHAVHARYFEWRDMYSIPREVVGYARYWVRRREG